jgi:hypothetical protein
MKPFRISQKAGGQSLLEYVGIPCLVVMVSLGSFTLLQGHLGQLALDSKKSIQNDIGLRNDAKKTLDTAAAIASVKDASPEVELMTSLEETSPLDETTSNFQDFPSGSLSETINTLGANGTISVMSQQIETIARNLLVTKKATPSQYNALLKLANQGYLLAQANYQIEKAAKESLSATDFKNKTIRVNGQSYPVNGFSTLTLTSSGSYNTQYDTRATSSSSLALDFVDLYNDFVNSGNIADRNVYNTVRTLFKSTLAVQIAADASRGRILNNGSTPDQLNQNTAHQISGNATDICLTGNNTSNGKKCSG